MRWARLDGQTDIDAWTILEADRHLYAGRVTCPDLVCGAKLHWRKRSKDGRASSFYGTHLDRCSYKVESDELIAEREVEEVDAILNTCEEMQIRLDGPANPRPRTQAEPGIGGIPGRRYQHRGNDQERRAGSTGLRPLLRKLVTSPAFREALMPLNLSDGTRTSIAQGCLHAIDYQLTDETRIVWGKITSNKGGWLDTGSRRENLPAVLVLKSALPGLLEATGVQHLSYLVGWHFLEEGRFTEKASGEGGPFLRLADAKRIAFLPS